MQKLRKAAAMLQDYFTLTPFLLPQADAEASIREGVSFRGVNILILIFAIFIASLGLNTNSTAVIIGAMLISPLMGPIIGIGLAVGIHDFDLLKRSFRNLLMATLFSVLTSCVYFLISPVSEGHSELLARTSPTIYDVLIGFFGGAAGIFAIGSKIKGNVIPGVAIATALMPPLCTVGYGLATLQPHYFLGASYLFFINSVFIATATVVGVRLMKYHYKDFSNPQRARRVRNIIYAVAVATMLPAVYLTYNMFVNNTFSNNCGRFVADEFQFPATQVVRYQAATNNGKRTLTVMLMGQVLPTDSLLAAMDSKLHFYHLDGTVLHIVQNGSEGGDYMRRTSQSLLSEMYTQTQATISTQRQQIDSLRTVLAHAEALDTISSAIAPELRVVFPAVRTIAVAHTFQAEVADGHAQPVDIALVNVDGRMDMATRQKLTEYLRARLALPNLTLIVD